MVEATLNPDESQYLLMLVSDYIGGTQVIDVRHPLLGRVVVKLTKAANTSKTATGCSREHNGRIAWAERMKNSNGYRNGQHSASD